MTNDTRSRAAVGGAVARDPQVHSGDLVFAGTRVPVATLVDYLKLGHSVNDFLGDFPTVDRWQVEAYLDQSIHRATTS